MQQSVRTKKFSHQCVWSSPASRTNSLLQKWVSQAGETRRGRLAFSHTSRTHSLPKIRTSCGSPWYFLPAGRAHVRLLGDGGRLGAGSSGATAPNWLRATMPGAFKCQMGLGSRGWRAGTLPSSLPGRPGTSRNNFSLSARVRSVINNSSDNWHAEWGASLLRFMNNPTLFENHAALEHSSRCAAGNILRYQYAVRTYMCVGVGMCNYTELSEILT